MRHILMVRSRHLKRIAAAGVLLVLFGGATLLFGGATRSAGQSDFLVLEDFESTPVGELPIGWEWKSSDDSKQKPYRVVEADGNK